MILLKTGVIRAGVKHKGPFTKYEHTMRASMDKNEENQKRCSLNITIIAFIRHVQGGIWRF